MTMEFRQLGRTGLEVSAIGLGTEHLERQRETMDDVLGTAVDADRKWNVWAQESVEHLRRAVEVFEVSAGQKQRQD